MNDIESAISDTLSYCDIAEVLGTPAQRKHAKNQRRLAMQALKELNSKSGLADISEDDLWDLLQPPDER